MKIHQTSRKTEKYDALETLPLAEADADSDGTTLEPIEASAGAEFPFVESSGTAKW